MIRVHNLSVRYGTYTAVEDAGFILQHNRVTVLLGPSGAGKTSLLRALNGLVRPAHGDIIGTDGQSIFSTPAALKAHRRATAMVFQQHHLVGRLSAHANVLNGRLAHVSRIHAVLPLPRQDRLLAMAGLDRVGLLDKAFQRADRLSGGEQQRVGIARALVQGAQLILADEPVASLDPATAAHVLDLIARLTREQHLTTVVSLHQVDLAKRYADRVIGLNAGRVVFDGAPSCLTDKALARIYSTSPSRSALQRLAPDDVEDLGPGADHALDRA